MVDDQELLALYAVEASEHLATLNETLLRLETSDENSPERRHQIEELSRAAHSLKGASRAVGMAPVEKVAHRMESIFDAVHASRIAMSPNVADVLYDALDTIQALLDQTEVDTDAVLAELDETLNVPAEPAADTPAPVIPAKPNGTESLPDVYPKTETTPSRSTGEPSGALTVIESPDGSLARAAEESIRIAVAKLDELMADASDLLVARSSLEQRIDEVKALRKSHQKWQKEWRKIRALYIRMARQFTAQESRSSAPLQTRPLLDFLSLTQRYMRLSSQQLQALDRALSADHMRVSLITDSLQNNIRRVRLVPFETQVAMFQRAVRDVAREVGKEVLLQISGANIELDKHVLEMIKDPIMHLLRNAVDHGIETPDERAQNGKRREGMIVLAISQRGGNVMILIADDGQGIDVAAVRRSARRILGDAAVDALSDADALSLITLPGLSTRDQITTISGRGIGLDVVRQNVESLQGRLDIESIYGLGTTFRLVIPVSLSTMRCMLAQIGEEIYAIPTSTIEQIVTMDGAAPDAQKPEMMQDTPQTSTLSPQHAAFSAGGRPMITVNDRAVGLAWLADVLERPIDSDPHYALVLAAGERRMAFLVDDLVAEQEMVVKSLNPELAHVRHVAGATLLGSGDVVIILNVSDLIKSAQGLTFTRSAVTPLPEPAAPVARTILVVDDSITTRTLERNILEAAGYEVVTATNGAEALDTLERVDCSIVVADVEMPIMNGFELTARIKKHDRFKQMPVIIVTSLDSAAHKEQGFRNGADAYIVKGNFDQGELLQTVRQLLSRVN